MHAQTHIHHYAHAHSHAHADTCTHTTVTLILHSYVQKCIYTLVRHAWTHAHTLCLWGHAYYTRIPARGNSSINTTEDCQVCNAVNILKILKRFVHFKSYILKFRMQYKLLCCILARIKAFLQNYSILCRPF